MKSDETDPYPCHSCQSPLSPVRIQRGQYWRCAHCESKTVPIKVLQQISSPQLVQHWFAKAKEHSRISKRTCPACRAELRSIETGPPGATFEIDVCIRCQLICFDAKELERLPGVSTHKLRAQPIKITAPSPAPAPSAAQSVKPADSNATGSTSTYDSSFSVLDLQVIETLDFFDLLKALK